jgi:hypothetical protein
MSDTLVRMLNDDTTHVIGEIGTLTNSTVDNNRWIQFTATRGAWCAPDEYEIVHDRDNKETPALAETPHAIIAAATDAFNEVLVQVAEQVATRCNLSISAISELLVSGWAFVPGTDGEPNHWTAPAESAEAYLTPGGITTAEAFDRA